MENILSNYYLAFTLKLLLAILLGGIIGIERKMSNKAAGFRTMILICLGSTIFAELAATLALTNGGVYDNNISGRVIGNIIAGIGFLGAGTIMKTSSNERSSVEGLTTAASIWAVAGIGVFIGVGFFYEAIITAFLVSLVLFFFGRLERTILKKVASRKKS